MSIIFTACMNAPISFFSEKHGKQTGFQGQNCDILIPPQIAIFEISIIFETTKSFNLVRYIVSALVYSVELLKIISDVVGINWAPKSNFL